VVIAARMDAGIALMGFTIKTKIKKSGGKIDINAILYFL
jgi:hypothetical protein